MNSCIYDKTDKGREEIATRKYQVRPKLRTLLVMIDGRHSFGALLKNFAVLGLSEENVDELLRHEYITLVSGGPAPDEPAPDAARGPLPPASARARMQARMRSQVAREGVAQGEIEIEVEVDEDVAPAAPMTAAPADADRFRALYEFYNQTVKSSIGLRGFALQLNVEKAASVDDLRALRLPYLQAVLKSKGRTTALELRERLDALLGGKPEPDDFALPTDNAAAPRGVFDYFNLANDSVNF